MTRHNNYLTSAAEAIAENIVAEIAYGESNYSTSVNGYNVYVTLDSNENVTEITAEHESDCDTIEIELTGDTKKAIAKAISSVIDRLKSEFEDYYSSEYYKPNDYLPKGHIWRTDYCL